MSDHIDSDHRTERFERLFRAQYPVVAGYLRRRVEPGLVDDLVNEVFLVAWRRLDDVPPSPRPWLLGVARNVVGTHIRGAKRRRALRERLAAVEVVVVEAERPLSGTAVAAALSALRPTDCEALMLVNWDGLTPSEAADVLGESPAGFRVRLHRARSRFRALLEHAAEPPGAGAPDQQGTTIQVTREVPNV
jgi:RNA polymerase sigma-70 factor (ECF subfamily)